ncbi:hypothetical protein GGX14DRAFT_658743 [Mycena pura]|uniref:Uncharacterized protein n=1 Tax=Mycena pura TaxID=153505 RepID=A0AAD6V354_9AGAR|nr:hypothetical protein GGX14DRAFT_658743 [Mycena pura]
MSVRASRDSSPNDELVDPAQEIQARLKRRIAELDHDLVANSGAKRTNTRTNITMGRIIRKAISFNHPVMAIIGEHDRRTRYAEDHGDLDGLQVDDEQRRLHNAYLELMKLIPGLKQTLASPDMDEYRQTLKELQQGAAAAVGDDNNAIRAAIIVFVPKPTAVEDCLDPESRQNRGSEGRLICPVDYDWDDPTIRTNIINGKTGYAVTANKWPRCIYQHHKYDPSKKFNGFLKAKGLVQVAMHIFTSPSSASGANVSGKYIEDSREEENIDPSAALELPRKKRKKTRGQPKGSVAARHNISHSTPRMIAYAAVQEAETTHLVLSCGPRSPHSEGHSAYDDPAIHAPFLQGSRTPMRNDELQVDVATITVCIMYFSDPQLVRLSSVSSADVRAPRVIFTTHTLFLVRIPLVHVAQIEPRQSPRTQLLNSLLKEIGQLVVRADARDSARGQTVLPAASVVALAPRRPARVKVFRFGKHGYPRRFL